MRKMILLVTMVVLSLSQTMAQVKDVNFRKKN